MSEEIVKAESTVVDGAISKSEVHIVDDEVPSSKRLVVVARNAEEMGHAQKKLISWADARIIECQKDEKELRENLEIAKKNKWRTATLQSHAAKATGKVEFYMKVKAALEAGYCIIPNFDNVEVYAVRTTRKEPKENFTTSTMHWDRVKNQQTTSPALGEGAYVSPQAEIMVAERKETDKAGKEVTKIDKWAEDFKEPDFPFHFAKPEILKDAAKAMQLKVFDEMAVLPRRRQGDPMVLGIIKERGRGWRAKTITFLVTWFVDTRDL